MELPGCPSAETIAAYLEDPSGPDAAVVEGHLASCPLCAELARDRVAEHHPPRAAAWRVPATAAAAALAAAAAWYGWIVPRRPAAWIARPGTSVRTPLRAGILAPRVTAGERWTFFLRNGSRVDVEGGTLLRIGSPDGSNVSLEAGRASFEVTPGTRQAVAAAGGLVEVHGTEFTVEILRLAPGVAGLPTRVATVHVARGLVRVATDSGDAMLGPGQRSVLGAGIPPPTLEEGQARAWLAGWRNERQGHGATVPPRQVLLNLLALGERDLVAPWLEPDDGEEETDAR